VGFFRIIRIYGNATILHNALGNTVAFLMYREENI
jgi:CRISPR/Cas system CMR-associated protein Cmr5 small subunit